MSGMFLINGKSVELKKERISVTTPVVIVNGADAFRAVVWLRCTEHTGGTPTLTVDIFDGTNATYLQNAVAMTAKQSLLIDHGIPIPSGHSLRVTASVANQVHVLAAVLLGNSSGS